MTKMFLAAAAALAMLASCSKNADEIADTAKGGVVKITLTDKTPAMTRAFFGTTAAAESWEKKINSLTLFVFDGSDRAVLQRRFSAAEISGQAATIPVPEAKPGELYKFYVVANSDNPEKVARPDRTEKHHGKRSRKLQRHLRRSDDQGRAKRRLYHEPGSGDDATAQAGQTTDVQIGIERLVAKIAVQTATDSKFAAAYPGRVKIASATVSRAASSISYFNGTQHSGGADNLAVVAHDFSQTQASKEQSGKYANLFYVYGSENSAPAENVLLTLEGVYDNDGDFATTSDQIPVSYEVALNGDSGKAISRNTYRRVSVNISGLTGADVAVTITPADWEGPINQEVNLGM